LKDKTLNINSQGEGAKKSKNRLKIVLT